MPEPIHDSEENIDFSDLEAKYRIEPDDGLETFVVVDGCPVIPESKVPALTKVLMKLFSSVGTIKKDGFFMPVEGGKTKGFAFVEYEDPAKAAEAVRTYNRKKLDQKHTLLVNKLGDIERFGYEGNVVSEYHEPEIEPFQPKDHLRSWLTDSQVRDQFVLHRGDNVGIFWNRKAQAPEPVVDRAQWTETFVRWSPKGSYLISVHPQGVQLWGGPKWTRYGRFIHMQASLIGFSPDESYMVTWSPVPIQLPPIGDPNRAKLPFKEQDEGNQLIVWDVKTVLPLRTFPMVPSADKENPGKVIWPVFKWSADSKYFARMVPGESLQVFETPSMGMLDKKPIKIPGIMEFAFAPAPVKLEGRNSGNGEQLLCYWTPEMPNQTARVCIMSLPTKEIIRSRNLFNVSGCRLHWQDQGSYLCVKVDRHTKSKKSIYTNLEFFRLNEKDIPVEVIELKETVVNFQWEPKGDRFVCISVLDQGTAMPQPAPKSIVSFYGLEKSKGVQGTWKLIKSFDNKTSNSIYWAPTGRFVITANVRPGSPCEMEFWDLDYEGEKKNYDKDLNTNLMQIGQCEHYGLTDVEWDPSGRYVATWSSSWKHPVDNGYKMWNFHGQLIREESIEGFKALSWRHRPASILPKQKKKEVNKNLKVYARRFEEEDAMEASEASRELIMRRKKALADWKEWREQVEAHLESLGLVGESKLVELHSAGDELIEEIREEIIEEKEEEV